MTREEKALWGCPELSEEEGIGLVWHALKARTALDYCSPQANLDDPG